MEQIAHEEKEKTAADWRQLGREFHLKGDAEQALACFESAVNLDPAFAPAYEDAAQLMFSQGHVLHGLDCYARAIAAAPADVRYKEKFIQVLREFPLRVYNENLATIINTCLNTPGVDAAGFGVSWLRLLKAAPKFKAVLKAAAAKNYPSFLKNFGRISDISILLSEYFLTGLKNVRVPDPVFEQLIIYLRRWLLDMVDEPHGRLNHHDFISLAEAVALYAYAGEYILDFSDSEKEKVAGLAGAGMNSRITAIVAAYMPLSAIAPDCSFDGLSELKKILCDQPSALKAAASNIISLTAIENDVSQKVQAQYEEFPYPRWTSLSSEIYNEDIEGRLKGKSVSILVAGCGTGREAIELALVFPQARILAVDLSRTSLSYATVKARQFNALTIDFRQADILQLKNYPEKFDFICSSGVLHHMQDPFAGWKILRDMLKDNGIMRIALYSAIAREPINEARKIIAKKGYSASADDIRRFRHDCARLLRKKTWQAITHSPDFYSLSECRDLLFHVQEHQFTIPEIQNDLQRLDLKFLGFQVTGVVLGRYKKLFPSAPPVTDLPSWAAFEQKNPDTFRAMYRFWCRG